MIMDHPWNIIRVVEWPGRSYITLDNGRLYCFRTCSRDLIVRAHVYTLPAAFTDLIRQYPSIMEPLLRHYDQDGTKNQLYAKLQLPAAVSQIEVTGP